MAPTYGFESTATEVANDLSANICGKTVLVTGVTPNSLGSHFVETIALHSPALIILASRTQSTMDATAAAISKKSPQIPIRSFVLDLGSLESTRKAAADIVKVQKDEGINIDVLVLNAGLMACPYNTTVDGFESQFGVCHLGHFVFGNLVIPGMLGSGRKPRVVVVGSEAHQLGPVRFTDPGFMNGQEYDKWRAYGQAKTANSLYAWSLAEKLGSKGLQAYSLHPGGIMTNLAKHIDMQGDDLPEMCMYTVFSSTCASANRWYVARVYRSVGSFPGFPEYAQTHKLKNHDQGTATHMIAAFADYFNGRHCPTARFFWT